VNTFIKYRLRLFVTGHTPASLSAQKNLRKLCEGELRGWCEFEVVDVLKQPELAEEARIIATPTLVKLTPEPQRKVIGDLSNHDQLLHVLDMHLPASEPAGH